METYIVHPTEQQEKLVVGFFKSLNVLYEKKEDVLPAHVLEGIKKGQEDIKAGRTVSIEDFKKSLSIYK